MPIWLKITAPVGVVLLVTSVTNTDDRVSETVANSTTSSVTTTVALATSTTIPESTSATTSVPSTVAITPATAAPPSTTTTHAPSTTAAPTTTTQVSGSGALSPLIIAPASHADSYDRDLFGDWIDADHDCKNTRAEVLIAESLALVTFTATGCTVATGKWNDPWTSATTTIAHDFDVDHTVPLANAWRSGAWAWDASRRKAFANDLSFANHLNAMDSGTNRSKGDDGPEDWRPPDQTQWCAYATAWSAIKSRWGLTVTTAEAAALQSMARGC